MALQYTLDIKQIKALQRMTTNLVKSSTNLAYPRFHCRSTLALARVVPPPVSTCFRSPTTTATDPGNKAYFQRSDTGLPRLLCHPPRPPRSTPRRRATHLGEGRHSISKNRRGLPATHGEAVQPDTTIAPAVDDDPQALCGAYSWSGHSRPSPHRARKPFPSRMRPQRHSPL